MKVWTCVASDTEGLAGVSVYATIEKAKADLAEYALDMAKECEAPAEHGVIEWTSSQEYGAEDLTWFGTLELTEETFDLRYQEVQA